MYLFAVPYTVLYTSHCRPLTWWAIVYGVFQFSSGKFLHSIYRVRSIMEILFLLSRFWWYYFFSFILYFLLLHVTTLHRYMYMAVVIYLYNYFVVGKCVNMCSEYPSSASFIVALFLFYFHSMSIHTLFGNVWCFNLFPFFPIHCSIAIPRRAVEQFYNRQLNIGCHHTKNFLLNITQSAF